MNKNRIFLRAFENEDYIIINKWRNDVKIQKLTSGTYRFVSLEREKEWVLDKIKDDSKDLYLSICLSNDTKKMIGYLSLNNIDYIHRKALFGGIVIGEQEYRDGEIVIEAILKILDYSFNELNLNRISGECLCEHKTSLKIFMAMGFKIEGIYRHSIYKHGKYYDQYVFAILRNEYDNIISNNGYMLDEILKRLNETNKHK